MKQPCFLRLLLLLLCLTTLIVASCVSSDDEASVDSTFTTDPIDLDDFSDDDNGNNDPPPPPPANKVNLHRYARVYALNDTDHEYTVTCANGDEEVHRDWRPQFAADHAVGNNGSAYLSSVERPDDNVILHFFQPVKLETVKLYDLPTLQYQALAGFIDFDNEADDSLTFNSIEFSDLNDDGSANEFSIPGDNGYTVTEVRLAITSANDPTSETQRAGISEVQLIGELIDEAIEDPINIAPYSFPTSSNDVAKDCRENSGDRRAQYRHAAESIVDEYDPLDSIATPCKAISSSLRGETFISENAGDNLRVKLELTDTRPENERRYTIKKIAFFDRDPADDPTAPRIKRLTVRTDGGVEKTVDTNAGGKRCTVITFDEPTDAKTLEFITETIDADPDGDGENNFQTGIREIRVFATYTPPDDGN